MEVLAELPRAKADFAELPTVKAVKCRLELDALVSAVRAGAQRLVAAARDAAPGEMAAHVHDLRQQNDVLRKEKDAIRIENADLQLKLEEAKMGVLKEMETAKTAGRAERVSELETLLTAERQRGAQLSVAADAARNEAEAERRAQKTSMDKIAAQGGEIHVMRMTVGALEEKTREYSELIATMTKRTAHEKGAEGELEVREFLGGAFGPYLEITDVSKRGQGRELDILLRTVDGIEIRIDTKNTQSVIMAPEIDAFEKHVDGMADTVHGAILFMRMGLRGQDACSTVKAYKRGDVHVYHIGHWDRGMLLRTIQDVIVAVKLERATARVKIEFPGQAQVAQAFVALTRIVGIQNEICRKVGDLATQAVQVPHVNRLVADFMKAAHTANNVALPAATLQFFEERIGKCRRGAPGALPDVGTLNDRMFLPPKNKPGPKRPTKRQRLDTDEEEEDETHLVPISPTPPATPTKPPAGVPKEAAAKEVAAKKVPAKEVPVPKEADAKMPQKTDADAKMPQRAAPPKTGPPRRAGLLVQSDDDDDFRPTIIAAASVPAPPTGFGVRRGPFSKMTFPHPLPKS